MPALSEFPEWFLIAVAVSLGLAFGSFLNVVIYRLPRGESVVHPPSRCPGCGASIRALDNVPVFGWLLLRGRARCCKVRISPRYPLVEACGGVLAWAVMARAVLVLAPETSIGRALLLFALYLALCLGLVAAIFIDLEHMILPDEITIGGAALGLLSVAVRDIQLVDAAIGAVTGYVIVWLPFHELYRRVRGQPGMGLGDAKLLMLTGAWFGYQGVLFALLAGAVQGTAFALVVLATKGRLEEPEAVRKEREELQRELAALEGPEREALEAELALDPLASAPGGGIGKARLAFGPFLALATLEFLFFGEELVGAYFGVLGG